MLFSNRPRNFLARKTGLILFIPLADCGGDEWKICCTFPIFTCKGFTPGLFPLRDNTDCEKPTGIKKKSLMIWPHSMHLSWFSYFLTLYSLLCWELRKLAWVFGVVFSNRLNMSLQTWASCTLILIPLQPYPCWVPAVSPQLAPPPSPSSTPPSAIGSCLHIPLLTAPPFRIQVSHI